MYDWAEFRHFRYLLAVLRQQGFCPGCEQLHTSQPKLTVKAQYFQEGVSIRLSEKQNGRIRPTETGVAFISLSRRLLDTRDEMVDDLIAFERSELSGVRLGCEILAGKLLSRRFAR